MKKLKNKLKHKGLFVWTILSLALIVVGFMHIPILSWCGVDVFALRGLLVITALPIVAVCAIPFAICFAKWTNIVKAKKRDSQQNIESQKED